MWSKIKKVLGVLTDLLLLGRQRGLWDKQSRPPGLDKDNDERVVK